LHKQALIRKRKGGRNSSRCLWALKTDLKYRLRSLLSSGSTEAFLNYDRKPEEKNAGSLCAKNNKTTRTERDKREAIGDVNTEMKKGVTMGEGGGPSIHKVGPNLQKIWG